MLALGIDIGGGSVKTAAVRDGKAISTAQSQSYHRPSTELLGSSVREAIERLGNPGLFDAVGLCAPGLMDDSRRTVIRSVNVPGLDGVVLAEFLADVLPGGLLAVALSRDTGRGGTRGPAQLERLTILTDAQAAAHDIYESFALKGRLLLLVIGTGVGAAVMDESGPLHVDGDSPGHFGQIDVSLETPGDPPTVGPDGGAGSLEAYIGTDALRRIYGPDLTDLASRIKADDPPIRALARAIRIAHAIYRPHHVVLGGGLGIRLGPLLGPLRRHVDAHLTSIARSGWTLATARHDHHAAIGAARIAAPLAASQ